MVLEAAVNGNADWLVTFNERDFRNAIGRVGFSVARPGEVLRDLIRRKK